MPPLTPEVEAAYGPWPPVEPCLSGGGHDWGLGAGEVVPFPAEGKHQDCPRCGCRRYTEFGRIEYQVPAAWVEARHEARRAAWEARQAAKGES